VQRAGYYGKLEAVKWSCWQYQILYIGLQGYLAIAYLQQYPRSSTYEIDANWCISAALIHLMTAWSSSCAVYCLWNYNKA
jgi:hypothetical protein